MGNENDTIEGFSFDLDNFDLGDFDMDDEPEEPKRSFVVPAAIYGAHTLEEFNEFIRANAIDGLPTHLIGGVDDTAEFVTAFLTAVKRDYDEHGVGTYDCILKFRSHAGEDALRRFMNASRQRISRIRQEASHHLPKFYVVCPETMIFREYGIAVVRMQRMTAAAYDEWFANRRSERAAKSSINTRLKDLL